MKRVDVYRQVIREASATPFEYGTNDCVLLASRVVHAFTGIDYSQAFRPYTKRKALRWIREAGGVEAFIAQFLGPSLPPNELHEARIADVVMLERRGREPNPIGLWTGRSAIAFKEHGGMTLVAPEAVECFWRVG